MPRIAVALFGCFLFQINISAMAQVKDSVVLDSPSGKIYGTLTVPTHSRPMPVVLIIAGSGPTDRDGNSALTQNNSLKLLGEGLNDAGIATLRYDKRGIAASAAAMKPEAEMRFEDYVEDATAIAQHLKRDKRFSKVIIAGHSEGSLIGMIAAERNHVAAYISLAGLGRGAADALKDQLNAQLLPVLGKEEADRAGRMIDSLSKGESVISVPPYLMAVFRPSIQPYLKSWFAYDPQQLISKLTMPVLILQGSTDIQVKVEDAELLHKALPKATMRIIEGMNHIFKQSEADRPKNIATYSKPELPVMPELIQAIVQFVNGEK